MNTQITILHAAIYVLSTAAVLSVLYLVFKKKRSREDKRGLTGMEKLLLALTIAGIALISIFVIARIVNTGHATFTNMFEFSIAFGWGILVFCVFFSFRYRSIAINLAGLILSTGLLLYANTLSPEVSPLVPALQNSFLLTAHVLSAVVAYGAFTVGFFTSLVLLVRKKDSAGILPGAETLGRISYHSVMIGFPFMTLVIVLGALWADVAWGRYWGWDPKETASLVTWLIYAVYLHTRVVHKWKGKKSAILLVIGFLAVILTFFGNYIFNGLHSYI